MIYLDNAATTFIKPACVKEAVIRAMDTMSSPGRGTYKTAARAAEELYECRKAAAELFNAGEPENVVFTMNATHGLNIAVKSLTWPGCRAVISGFEHNSVLRPLTASGAEIDTAGRKAFDSGNVLDEFEKKLPGADLTVCTHVSNVFGFILPIYEIAELCRKNSVPLIVDASQSAGILDVDMKKLGAAFTVMPGHKGLFGPQGTGLLLCASGAEPLMEGGTGSDSESRFMPEYLPDRLEAGTHNVCGIAGLRAGLNFIKGRGLKNIAAHEHELLNILINSLSSSGYELFSGREQCSILSMRHPRISPEELSERLSENGVCTRCGLHCAPLAHESAGTLDTGTLRLSFSPLTGREDAYNAASLLREIV